MNYISGRNLTDMMTTNNYNTSLVSFIKSSLTSLSYGAVSTSLVDYVIFNYSNKINVYF